MIIWRLFLVIAISTCKNDVKYHLVFHADISAYCKILYEKWLYIQWVITLCNLVGIITLQNFIYTPLPKSAPERSNVLYVIKNLDVETYSYIVAKKVFFKNSPYCLLLSHLLNSMNRTGVEQSIVICLWGTEHLFANPKDGGKLSICEMPTKHHVFIHYSATEILFLVLSFLYSHLFLIK